MKSTTEVKSRWIISTVTALANNSGDGGTHIRLVVHVVLNIEPYQALSVHVYVNYMYECYYLTQ